MAQRQISSEQKSTIFVRDGGKCQYCGDPAEVIDHVVPWIVSHDNSLHNLVAACKVCNAIAKGRSFLSFADKRLYILKCRSSVEKTLPPYDVKYERNTYRLPEGMHSGLKEIAAAEGVGLNDLVRWILHSFIQNHRAGRIMIQTEKKTSSVRSIVYEQAP